MLDDLLARLRPLAEPATDAAILAAETAIGRPLPPDYKHFLRLTNGLPGRTPTQSSYLSLFAVEDLPHSQQWHPPPLPRPVLCFGTNGGGDGFFFDYATPGPAVLMIAFISNWTQDALWHGDSFTDFLDRATSGWDPFKGAGSHRA